jgi:hypothetical protein
MDDKLWPLSSPVMGRRPEILGPRLWSAYNRCMATELIAEKTGSAVPEITAFPDL